MKTIHRKKPVLSQSEILKLKEEEQNQIINWLVCGTSLSKVREKVNAAFNLNLKSDISIMKYWNVIGVTVMRWQDFRPDHISPIGWEVTRREYVKELEKPGLPLEQRKAIIKFLETGRFQKSTATGAEPGTADTVTPEEPNPLDDQDKLDEVRRQVFGSAPQS